MRAKPSVAIVILGLLSMSIVAQPKNSFSLSAKTVDKNLAKVSDSLYAYKYETSNAEFNLFLQSLKASNEALYQKYKTDSSAWLTNDLYSGALMQFYHRHPAYSDYPAVTMSYDAALAYCEWLTDLYNSDIKRKFKKVVFTLPTEDEWMRAAEGGRSQAIFPWSNYYLRDKNGMYLCNFKTINEAMVISDSRGQPVFLDSTGALHDRAAYTAKVKSFNPNAFGLYNVSGNVAEMTTEKGLTKGGSWNSYGGEVMIRSRSTVNRPSPYVGFRVFMRIAQH